MQLAGEQQIAASRQRVWEALNDPDILQRAIPGCQSLERTVDDGFAAVVEVRIGPIGARFNGKFQLRDLQPPESYTLVGEGKGGMAGNARGSADVRLSDAAGGTLLSYVVNAEVGGRLAQLGGPVVEATARQLSARFFQNFEQLVTGAGRKAQAAAASGAVSVPAASAQTPWPWLALVALAISAGFLLGRSDAADWWVAAMIVLAVAAGVVGFRAGRGGQT